MTPTLDARQQRDLIAKVDAAAYQMRDTARQALDPIAGVHGSGTAFGKNGPLRRREMAEAVDRLRQMQLVTTALRIALEAQHTENKETQ